MTTAERQKPTTIVKGEQYGPRLAGAIARAWAALHPEVVIGQVVDVVRERAERFDEPFAATVTLARTLGVAGIVTEARAKSATDKNSVIKMHVDHWDAGCVGPATQLALLVEELVQCDFCGCREAHWRHKEHGFPCDPAVMQPIMQAEHEADKGRWKPGTLVHDGRFVITRSEFSLDEHAPTWFRWSDSLGLSSYHGASGSHFWDAGDDRTRLAKYARWYIEETRAEFVTFDLFGGATRDDVKIAAYAAEVRAREILRRTELGPSSDDEPIVDVDAEDESADELEDEFDDDDFEEEGDETAVSH